jgi:outer membrane protein OmpA-like peptidoglycan-associated protein
MMIKQETFFKIIMMSLMAFFLLLTTAHRKAEAYAQTFLVPHDFEQKGSVYIVYPSNQRYVYTDNPVFISKRQIIQDGNEEDAYFQSKAKKETRPIVTLPLGQIIQQVNVQKAEKSTTASPKKKEHLMASIAVFDFDKYNLKDSEKKEISDALDRIKKAETIEIKGYTDKIGTEEYNDKLALKRAESVKKYLISNGIDERKIKIEAKGKCCYISPKDSENRRVEIWVEIENGGLHISQ